MNYWQATEALETRIKNMTETYASGVTTMKELANEIRRSTSSDLEEMSFAFSSQIEDIEQVCYPRNPRFSQVAYKRRLVILYLLKRCWNFAFVVPCYCGSGGQEDY